MTGKRACRGAVLALLLCHGVAWSLPKERLPARVDITPVRDKLELYHDGKGHYLAVMHMKHRASKLSPSDHVYYGDGKRFFRQRCPGASRSGEDFSFTVADPRVLRRGWSSFDVRKGEARFTCERRKTPLQLVPEPRASAMLNKASFHDVYWNRVPHSLARDQQGTYYYVDRLRRRDRSGGGARGFRVYAGPRGRLKRLRMKNVVADPMGEIFVTTNGKLRLVLDRSRAASITKATWVAGKRPRLLTVVPVSLPRTRVFIYRDLGVYSAVRLHRPCDDL